MGGDWWPLGRPDCIPSSGGGGGVTGGVKTGRRDRGDQGPGQDVGDVGV